MTEYEKSVIETLPRKYRPIGTIAYLLYTVLYAIPVIGFIFSLLLSIRPIVNVNVKYYARLWLGINSLLITVVTFGTVALLLFTDISLQTMINIILEYIK